MESHDVLQQRCRNLIDQLEGVCLGLRASGSESAAEVASLIDRYIKASTGLDASHSRLAMAVNPTVQTLPCSSPCDLI